MQDGIEVRTHLEVRRQNCAKLCLSTASACSGLSLLHQLLQVREARGRLLSYWRRQVLVEAAAEAYPPTSSARGPPHIRATLDNQVLPAPSFLPECASGMFATSSQQFQSSTDHACTPSAAPSARAQVPAYLCQFFTSCCS